MSRSRGLLNAFAAACLVTLTAACGSQIVSSPGTSESRTGPSAPAGTQTSAGAPATTSRANRFGPDGTGAFTGLGTTSTIDTDGDGKPDTFRVPIKVTVLAPGTYHVSLDLSQKAEVVLSAPGTAKLATGPGVINVDISGEELLFVGANGVFEVTDVVLGEGTDGWRLVAQTANLGQTGPLRSSEITRAVPTQLPGARPGVMLTRPASSEVDSDGDGRYDVLRFTGEVITVRPGDYLLSGLLAGPTGQSLAMHEETLALPQGHSKYRIDFPGELVGAYGSGYYSLAGLRVTAVTNVSDHDQLHTVQTRELKANQWVGKEPNTVTLRAMWQVGQASGAIESFEFFVREQNRLERVAHLIDLNETAAARSELDTFISNVRQAAGVDQAWQGRVIDYATKLRGVL